MELDWAIDQVYAAEPQDFMSVRTALVAEARQAKDRALAQAIGALRKPTRSAWMINVLARSAPDEIGALLDLGDALREAQAQLSGPELRRLSVERQKAVAALGRRAAAIAAEHGHRATDAQLQEVIQHLQAALADPVLAADVRAGRVAQIVTFGGFGPWEATAAEAARVASSARSSGPGPQPDQPTPTGPTQEEIAAARSAREQAGAAVHRAETQLVEAADLLRMAESEVARLRSALADAEAATTHAAERRATAGDRLSLARAEADAAEQALQELLDSPG